MTRQDLSMQLFCRPLPSRGGLSEYLSVGELSIPSQVLFAICIDVEHRATWDASTIHVEELEPLVVERGFGEEEGLTYRRRLHWLVELPAIVGKRDYVFEQRMHTLVDGAGVSMKFIENRSFPSAESLQLQPLGQDVVRIDNWRSHMVIWPGGESSRTRFVLLYFEDPRLTVPNWIISRMVCSAMPAQFHKLVEASKQFPQFRLEQVLERFRIVHGSTSDHECYEFFSCSEDEYSDCAISGPSLSHKDSGKCASARILPLGCSSKRFARSYSSPWWVPQHGILSGVVTNRYEFAFSRIYESTHILMNGFAASMVSFGVNGLGIAAYFLRVQRDTSTIDVAFAADSSFAALDDEDESGIPLFDSFPPGLRKLAHIRDWAHSFSEGVRSTHIRHWAHFVSAGVHSVCNLCPSYSSVSQNRLGTELLFPLDSTQDGFGTAGVVGIMSAVTAPGMRRDLAVGRTCVTTALDSGPSRCNDMPTSVNDFF